MPVAIVEQTTTAAKVATSIYSSIVTVTAVVMFTVIPMVFIAFITLTYKEIIRNYIYIQLFYLCLVQSPMTYFYVSVYCFSAIDLA